MFKILVESLKKVNRWRKNVHSFQSKG